MYENTYNVDLSRKLAKSSNPEKTLEQELKNIGNRAKELDQGRKKIEAGAEQMLVALSECFSNFDLNDPNLKNTPERMARAFIEICSGLGVNDKEVFSTTFPSGSYDEVIMLKDIQYTSMCAHHFFPFVGKAHIGYLPDLSSDSKSIVGLSKLARIVDCYARRPQLQERMCTQILDAMNREVAPSGTMVVIEGQHSCLGCRGARKQKATMITSAISGRFKENPMLRSEFLGLLRMDNN